ncbi:Uncharacterised protein [Kluyvera cryocrescens]|uniref:Uncharacterized protein n=1 Tax=Kluyvera cryocrescens TaxID=580 RepID=A0A485CWZ0_KLUCR|nr:Uncharacterised protein [Kluyvera cryocrescens]
MLFIRQLHYLNYFIYLINCSAFGRILCTGSRSNIIIVNICSILCLTIRPDKGGQIIEVNRNILPDINVAGIPPVSAHPKFAHHSSRHPVTTYLPDRMLYLHVHILSLMPLHLSGTDYGSAYRGDK